MTTESSPDGSPRTIKLGPGMVAFVKGVSAGESAHKALANQRQEERPRDEVMAYWWLSLGVAMQREGIAGDAVREDEFVSGAVTRFPRRPGLALEIRTSNAAFHPSQDPDSEDYDSYQDEDDVRAEVARLLRQVSDSVANGFDEGDIRDANGQLVGQYRIV